MEPPIVVALVAGVITALGWLVNHVLTDRSDRAKQRTEDSLKYVERQLEELYGPLAFLIYEGQRTFLDLLDALGRDYVFKDEQTLSEKDLKTWLFWTEQDFLPRNEEIKHLLMSKTQLIDGPHFPESYVAFLDHHNSWAIRHKRWKEEGVKYSWHSQVNMPTEFGQEIITTFETLKAKHAALLGELTRQK